MTPPLAAAVAAHGLPSGVRSLPDRPLPAHQWRDVLGDAKDARTIGWLAQAVDDGSFATTEAQAEEAYELHAEAMGLALVLERLLLDVVALLSDAGVDHRVLKGSAVAHLDYPDPALRPFGDVDVLVPAERFDMAVATLLAAGFVRERPQLRPGFDRRFAKSTTLTSTEQLPLDLHRTLAAGRFGFALDAGDLFASSSPFRLGGRRLLALAPEERFLHACYHAVLGSPKPPLLALRDIAQMLLTKELDLVGVQRRCTAWQGQAVLARAVVLTWDTFGMVEPSPLLDWSRQYRPDAADRWVLRAHTVGRSGGTQAITAVAAITGVRQKLAFLWALIVPQRAFLGDGKARYWRWWARGAAALVHAVGRG
ncbi:MAG: nucleotidyltransferase family protein [Acidimicrobiales bacterium]